MTKCPCPLSSRRGLTGAYYNDLGYRNARSVFITPRTGTVWVSATRQPATLRPRQPLMGYNG